MSGLSSPALPWRGLVEGFYGEPWSHADRVAWFAFGSGIGLDHYVYAPKDDPWHRDRWREPYPADRLQELSALNAAAADAGVRFVYAISPGLSMRFDDDAEHRALAAKCRQLLDAGIRSFALLFDDVPQDDPERLGRAHGDAAARLQRDLLLPAGIDEPMLVCPTDYAGVHTSPYRTGLAETLPRDARLFWTGPDIVVGEITPEDIERATSSYGRELVLWDNFPVNDFDRSRVFLGPLTGRSAGSGLVGVAANPMVEAAPSRFALATVAEWAADPGAYEPEAAARRAYRRVMGDADGLRTLVAACSAWPPGAPRWPELGRAIDARQWSDAEALLARLAETDATGAPADLATQLHPWVEAARAAGSAGVLACRVLRGDTATSIDALRAARRELEREFADVARADAFRLLDDAVRALGGEPSPSAAGARGTVALITGRDPAPGDRELTESLRAAGFDVQHGRDPAADLVVVTRAASEDDAVAAGRLPIPLLAWGHLRALGLATDSFVPLSLDRIHIADPDHPVAAGLEGAVAVYRGRSKLTWGVPPAGAEVIAIEPESGNPAIAAVPRGTALADGTPAPAARASFFLSTDGFAPWLVTDETRALLLATLRWLHADGRTGGAA